LQDERQAAASSLVQALVDSQKQHESSHMPAGAQPGGTLDMQQEGGNRQQRMEQCLNCCSPLMVSVCTLKLSSVSLTVIMAM
jgi:hypothetical protein